MAVETHDPIDEFNAVSLAIVLAKAAAEHDGHVTLMRFTTGWKIIFGTPSLDLEDQGTLRTMDARMSLGAALDYASKWDHLHWER